MSTNERDVLTRENTGPISFWSQPMAYMRYCTSGSLSPCGQLALPVVAHVYLRDDEEDGS